MSSFNSVHIAFVSTFPYSERVGLLLYLGVVSRPDIMYAIDILTRHLKHLSCKAVRRVHHLSHGPACPLNHDGAAEGPVWRGFLAPCVCFNVYWLAYMHGVWWFVESVLYE